MAAGDISSTSTLQLTLDRARTWRACFPFGFKSSLSPPSTALRASSLSAKLSDLRKNLADISLFLLRGKGQRQGAPGVGGEDEWDSQTNKEKTRQRHVSGTKSKTDGSAPVLHEMLGEGHCAGTSVMVTRYTHPLGPLHGNGHVCCVAMSFQLGSCADQAASCRRGGLLLPE